MLPDIISKFKSGFDCYTELRHQINRVYSLTLNSDGSRTEDINARGGVSARVYLNNAFGFCASGETDEAAIIRDIETAKRNALALGRYATLNGTTLMHVPHRIIPINDPVKEIDTKLLRSAAEDLKQYASAKYPTADITVYVHQYMSEKHLVVYDGCDGRSNVVLGSIWVTLSKVTDDGEYVEADGHEGYDVYLSDVIEPKRLYAIADAAYEDLQKRLAETNASKITVEAGEHDCILSPQFTSMLAHEAVGHTCEADAVIQKGSVAAANMGKQVASELVSLTDFANTVYGEHCPIPLYIDDEGTPCIDAPIIKNGILVGCMTNRLTAERLGVPATGNARASQFYDEPIIRMRNTCFHAGTSSLDDMIAAIDHGYYLTRSGGGNGDLDGRFNMTATAGHEIVHGKLGRPISGTIVSGLAWDALKTVDMVSSNFVESKSTGECGKKQSIPTGQGGPEMKLRLTLS